jgi:glucose-1-phosphate cytidylyltransferase
MWPKYCTTYLGARIKTIILAGGLGTRISEETADKPKPMVLIGNKPILWHVMNIYAQQGFRDFIVAAGYKAEIIETWVREIKEPWNVVTMNTGLNTQTGGRIKRCMEAFPDKQYFVTYGDGLGNVNLYNLIKTHERMGRKATVTAVRPPARFGVLEIDNEIVTHFGEKPQTEAGWINGGFFLLERGVKDLILGDSILFETGPLGNLANANQLAAYKHYGFWKPMDTLREKRELDDLVKMEPAPWLL